MKNNRQKWIGSALSAGVLSLVLAGSAFADEGVEIPHPHTGYAQPTNYCRQAVGATFYDTLAPHGTWHVSAAHGWVWSPGQSNFRPYVSNGSWVHTNQGWMFNSRYSWGWIPFHYGRWYRDASYGWSWVPGNQWAPAWVDWRHGSDHVGWSPLGPGDVALAGWWAFVGAYDIGRPWVNRYLIPRHRHRGFLGRTRHIHRRHGHWSYGPPIDFWQRRGRRYHPVRRAHIAAPRRGHVTRYYLNGGRTRVRRYGRVTLRPRHRADRYRPGKYRPGKYRPGKDRSGRRYQPHRRAERPHAAVSPRRHAPARRMRRYPERLGYRGQAPRPNVRQRPARRVRPAVAPHRRPHYGHRVTPDTRRQSVRRYRHARRGPTRNVAPPVRRNAPRRAVRAPRAPRQAARAHGSTSRGEKRRRRGR